MDSSGRIIIRSGAKPALSTTQQLAILTTIARFTPDLVGLPQRLWTRQAVADLIQREFGLSLGAAVVGRYLVSWGLLTENNLLYHLVVQQAALAEPAAEFAWLNGGSVLWGTWWRPYLPVVPGFDQLPPETAARLTELAGKTVLIAVSNRGSAYFELGGDHDDARRVREFVERLVEQVGRKVNIVLGWRPRRHFAELSAWLDDNADTAAVRFVEC